MPTESWEYEKRVDGASSGPEGDADGASSGSPAAPASDRSGSAAGDRSDGHDDTAPHRDPARDATQKVPEAVSRPGTGAPGAATSALPAGAVPSGAEPTGPPPGATVAGPNPGDGAPADAGTFTAATSAVPAGSMPTFTPPSGPPAGVGGTLPPPPRSPGAAPGQPSGAGSSLPAPPLTSPPLTSTPLSSPPLTSPPSGPPTSGYGPTAGANGGDQGHPGQAASYRPAPYGQAGYQPAPGHGAQAQPSGPFSPPLQQRSDVPRRDGLPATPPTLAAPVSGPEPDAERVVPAAGWGWRSLAAFVAGGLLAAGGFAVAQLGDDGSPEQQVVAAATTTTVQATSETIDTEETTSATVDPPTADSAVEPASHVADVLGPSVVQIETDFGIGSGVVYDDGLIITNHHVVADATSLRVIRNDGSSVAGQLLGSNADVDVAVVAVDPGVDLPPATLALGEKPTVGQTAIAIGSPFRLQQSVTEGIVSAVDRPVPSGASIVAMIQTDAPINPGNSGGALADRQGRVIGINTAIQTGGATATNAGVGFAIPIDTAVSVADRIVAGEPIEPGFLGVSGGPTDDSSAGVQVTEVTPESAADVAGLEVGDHILSIDGAPVTAFQDLIGLIVAHSPGDEIDIDLIRNGEPITVTATLGRKNE